jgi:tungstate transport system substrate-binding protein
LIVRRGALFLALLFCAFFARAELRLGATHTLEDSGLLAVLIPAFEAAHKVKVRPVIAGTGQVLRYAEQGDVDVVFTHSRADEERLVAAGVGRVRRDVMWNDFVVAGPAAEPAHVRGLRDAAEALRRIRASGARFISRGDDSGTHKVELRLWAAIGGLKAWPGYLVAGQGAGKTLMMASELDAYDLVDRATLRQFAKRAPLQALVEGDARLLNEYAVTTVRRTPSRPVNERDADLFAAWVVSAEGRRIVSGYRIGGESAFHLRE